MQCDSVRDINQIYERRFNGTIRAATDFADVFRPAGSQFLHFRESPGYDLY